jgi:hypothetical protein
MTDTIATYNLLHFIADVLYIIGDYTPGFLQLCWNWPYTIAIALCVWSLLCFAVFLRISLWVWNATSAFRRLSPV